MGFPQHACHSSTGLHMPYLQLVDTDGHPVRAAASAAAFFSTCQAGYSHAPTVQAADMPFSFTFTQRASPSPLS